MSKIKIQVYSVFLVVVDSVVVLRQRDRTNDDETIFSIHWPGEYIVCRH